MIDWGGPFHNFAAPRYNLLAITANNAATITFSQWLDVMSRTVGILWLILLPMTFGFLWMWFHHPAQPRFTRRPLNIHTLPPYFFSSVTGDRPPVLADGDNNRLFHGQKTSRAPCRTNPPKPLWSRTTLSATCSSMLRPHASASWRNWGNH